jgi:hypothetical protein
VLVFMVNQTDQERTEGVRRLLGGRARAGQHRLNMRVIWLPKPPLSKREYLYVLSHI